MRCGNTVSAETTNMQAMIRGFRCATYFRLIALQSAVRRLISPTKFDDLPIYSYTLQRTVRRDNPPPDVQCCSVDAARNLVQCSGSH